jgi:hypothetical protein
VYSIPRPRCSILRAVRLLLLPKDSTSSYVTFSTEAGELVLNMNVSVAKRRPLASMYIVMYFILDIQ